MTCGSASGDDGAVGLALRVLPFALSTTLTPGPNTILVTASAATYGLRRTVPLLFGMVLGFPLLMTAVGFGLGELFSSHPGLHAALRWVGCVYLLWLAWALARARPSGDADARGRPIGFARSAALQWVNPKAWVMSITAVTTFTTVGGEPRREVPVIVAVFTLLSLVALPAWALCGVALGRFLGTERRLRVFNVAMAVLLVASLVPLVFEPTRS
jgi:threonine/homoserine/homoserine lactone efflux protein